MNKRTTVYYFLRLRVLITQVLTKKMPFAAAIDVDERYVGGRRKGRVDEEQRGKYRCLAF